MIMMTIKMKKIVKILPLAICFLWVGCEDLDFPDPNNPTSDTATIQSLVTGAEAGLRYDIGIYLRNVLVIGREAYYLEPADPRYTGELMTGPVDPGGFLANRPWSTNYKVIQNCLTLVNNPDADSGSNGFAKTLHAYCLWRILNLTDENGARLNYDGDITVAVASKSAVMSEIESLLDDAYSDLTGAGSAFSFSLSDGFSGFDTPATFAQFNRALRARVAVHQDDWGTASTALDDSFLDESGDLDVGVYHVFSSGSNDQDNEMYEAADADFVKLMVHPSYLTDAEEGDLRMSSNVSIRADTIKYDELESYLAPTVWSSSYDPVPIIRNEELILLKAEADIGSGGDGLTEINIIRAAHGLADATSGGLEQLLHEKRYSLFLEGQRLIDMRHYGKTDELPIDRPARGDTIVIFPIPETEVPG
jgi:hypothetical protein|tara:strand:+ start:3158 stop:4417 length:1260 start_codon:yes stop_codon:yes gene_type:complete